MCGQSFQLHNQEVNIWKVAPGYRLITCKPIKYLAWLSTRWLPCPGRCCYSRAYFTALTASGALWRQPSWHVGQGMAFWEPGVLGMKPGCWIFEAHINRLNFCFILYQIRYFLLCRFVDMIKFKWKAHHWSLINQAQYYSHCEKQCNRDLLLRLERHLTDLGEHGVQVFEPEAATPKIINVQSV